MTSIAIFGGHGKVALTLSRLLVAAGHDVRSIFRNEDHVQDVLATGATPVVADLETSDVPAMAELLHGVEAVVWTAGAGGGSEARTYAVDRDAAIRSMNATVSAGATRYVMVSYFGAGPDHGVAHDNSFFAYAEAKAAADEYLRGTGLDWTILGPSSLTDDEPTSRIEINDGSVKGGSVDRADVAAVIAGVLDLPASYGRIIEFNNGATPIGEALEGL
ncbi:SDR family oxidoreductase [Allobranchiibius sp. GilTou38]|uniref:SDR family oxidoreductase n=1 Tax=Allobranchiibius sp. GilTou38 TaxID=2815210 RepID=UPI001AA14463|nr:SDR family oxidoreductase [Allobranchiibius sp. GilTou38]MBO1767675.1 SDR family oxidoreductase [Allobranchiibius sp. GilTou38]